MLQTLSSRLFEVIIILNGSEQPYRSDICSYIRKNGLKNFHLHYCHLPGVSNARNTGIELAGSDYLCFVDDDDMVSEEFLAGMLRLKSSRAIVAAAFRSFSGNDNNCHMPDHVGGFLVGYKPGKSLNIAKAAPLFSVVCGKLIPRTVIGSRRFNPDFLSGEDSLFMAMISDKTERVIVASAAACYYRRIRLGSASLISRTYLWRVKNDLALLVEYLRLSVSGNRSSHNIFLAIKVFRAFLNLFASLTGRKKKIRIRKFW
jgi:glycosyltransferase involved in cell wall biosynthesis